MSAENISVEINKPKDRSVVLIAICWLVYTCAYIGKLGYNANIIQIEAYFNVSHATAGIVGTFFFFSYGIGQVVNGIFCKRYPLKYMVFAALIISSACNVALTLLKSFTVLKYVWLVNGFTLSVLWPSLIRFLSENVSEKYISKAIIAMGTTVATGTIIVYSASALFVYLNRFKLIFYLAGGLLPIVAVLWLIVYPKKTNDPALKDTNTTATAHPSLRASGLMFPIAMLAFFAVINNLTKDGLTTWVPSILNELYSLNASLSILLTLLLPIMAVFGVSVAVLLNKKIKDLVNLSSIFYLVSALLIAVVLIFLNSGAAIPLICLAIVSLVMSAVNNIITSMAPLMWKDKINSGMLAGVLDGFCYLGSALSSYGLGSVADKGGWNSVFILLCSLTAFCALFGFTVYLISCFKKKKAAK